MSGIFSVLGSAQAGLLRMQQAGKAFEKANAQLFEKSDNAYRKELGPQSLAEKAGEAQSRMRVDPEWLRGAHSAMTAMEEARRINSPKAAAEERLSKAERRMEELRKEARLAAARGDREKLAQLAREAAQLAREAGRAAKEFSIGVSAAAAMGKGATTGGSVEITRETTVTTVTVASVETKVELRVGTGGEAAPAASPVPAAETAADGEVPADGGELIPEEMMDLALQALDMAQSGALPAAATGDRGRQMMQKMFEEGELKASRYKEADAFARRIERVVAHAKNILTEAKAANELDTDEARRKERREGFKEDEKGLDMARDAVQDLRAAAMESGIPAEDVAGALLDTTVGADAGAVAVDAAPPTVNVTA